MRDLRLISEESIGEIHDTSYSDDHVNGQHVRMAIPIIS